jgi:MYXO-CTERM domain-containing protein
LGSGTAGTGAPSGWTRTEYKDNSGHVMLQTNLGPASQAHDLTSAGLNGQVISFLGLDKPTGSCGLDGGGGASGTGGAPSTDGGGTTAGGNEAVGGETVGNTIPASPSNSGGCGCRMAGKNGSAGSLWSLGLLGIALAALRKLR